MDVQYLPDWLYGFAPPSWWPARARDMFVYGLNLIPLTAGATLTQSVAFSGRQDALVWGGIAFLTTTDGVSVVNPLGGTTTGTLVSLSNSAAGEVYTSGPVPLESLFGTMFGLFANAGFPPVWPMPLAMPRGGALQVKLTSFLAIDVNLRLSFLCALIDTRSRKVA